MTREEALEKLDRLGKSLATAQAALPGLVQELRDLREAVAAEGKDAPGDGEQQTLEG